MPISGVTSTETILGDSVGLRPIVPPPDALPTLHHTVDARSSHFHEIGRAVLGRDVHNRAGGTSTDLPTPPGVAPL